MTTIAAEPELATTLSTAASLITATVGIDAPAAADVSVTVSGVDINVQVPRHLGDETARAAVVAAYAHALTAPVRRRDSGQYTWIETRGAVDGHPIRVWTVADTTTGQENG